MSTIPTGVDPTSAEAARNNIFTSSLLMCDHINEEFKNRYLSAFDDWCISVVGGYIPNTNPPQPPNGYQLSKPDENGYQWPERGDFAVCAVPPVPAGPPVATKPAPAAVSKVNAPPGDTHKDGEQVLGAYLIAHGNPPDVIGDPNALWTKRIFRGPFGNYSYFSAPGVV